MLLQVLKSKLKEVIITAANTNYEGSITLDPDLMRAANLRPYERVEVNGVNSDSRIVTYVIPGERGSGCVELNGGAANLFIKGEHIHVNCFAAMNNSRYNDLFVIPYLWGTRKKRYPRIVKTDKNNKIIG